MLDERGHGAYLPIPFLLAGVRVREVGEVRRGACALC
jgi:hypothetical protein